jgi:hypothetical protein
LAEQPQSGRAMADKIRGPSRSATAEIIARFANAGRDDPTIAGRLGITVAQVRGLREEFGIPPGETRWSHGHERQANDAEDAATAAGEAPR